MLLSLLVASEKSDCSGVIKQLYKNKPALVAAEVFVMMEGNQTLKLIAQAVVTLSANHVWFDESNTCTLECFGAIKSLSSHPIKNRMEKILSTYLSY